MIMNHNRERIKEAKRIVVKVGTSTLTHSTGKMNFLIMDKLARVISELSNRGKEVILVSSGAIGVGCGKLNLNKKPVLLGEKQAVAAVGQCELMHMYSKFFSDYNYTVGQILLTQTAVQEQNRKNNILNTFQHLFAYGVIPIVNENDSVSTEEIKSMDSFGDNDTLSAVVTTITGSDLLIILSDIDGFYDCDPRENTSSSLISLVERITPELEAYAGGAGTNRGTGGMKTKINAAKIVTSSGADMVLVNGSDPDIILDVLSGNEIGTLFCKDLL